MRILHRLGVLATAGSLATLGVALGPAGHAQAATGCDDGQGNEFMEVPILSSPITLALEIGDGNSLTDPHLILCYGTNSEAQNAAGDPEILGGDTVVDVLNPASQDGASTVVGMDWDTNSDIRAGWKVTSNPSVTTTPGALGETITLSVPFNVCLATCTPGDVGVGPTGVLVAQVIPVAEPGVGIGYELNGIQVEVDGIALPTLNVGQTGAYVNPFVSLERSLDFTQGGPCAIGVCVPKGYIATSAPVAGIQILGMSADLPTCIYTNPSGQCP